MMIVEFYEMNYELVVKNQLFKQTFVEDNI